MTNIELAEIICDILKDNTSYDDLKKALCELRNEVMCKNSPIGSYKCYVPITFSPQSGLKTICVDTCLQDEVYKLIREHGVVTVGCCCGHGITQPFIQVDSSSVEKMAELGYDMLPLDEHGLGANCFKPKTIL